MTCDDRHNYDATTRGITLEQQTNVNNNFAVYTQRDDGDFTRVAYFIGDEGADHDCEVTERTEALSYHHAHEFAAMLEYDDGESTFILANEFALDFPSIYCPHLDTCPND